MKLRYFSDDDEEGKKKEGRRKEGRRRRRRKKRKGRRKENVTYRYLINYLGTDCSKQILKLVLQVHTMQER